MLEGLNAVAWHEIDHAYGPALDTPGHLRALLSNDPEAVPVLDGASRTAVADLVTRIAYYGDAEQVDPGWHEAWARLKDAFRD